jgi:hypothetical protein
VDALGVGWLLWFVYLLVRGESSGLEVHVSGRAAVEAVFGQVQLRRAAP